MLFCQGVPKNHPEPGIEITIQTNFFTIDAIFGGWIECYTYNCDTSIFSLIEKFFNYNCLPGRDFMKADLNDLTKLKKTNL